MKLPKRRRIGKVGDVESQEDVDAAVPPEATDYLPMKVGGKVWKKRTRSSPAPITEVPFDE